MPQHVALFVSERKVDANIVGRTAVGRTTIPVLNMNSDEAIELRFVDT